MNRFKEAFNVNDNLLPIECLNLMLKNTNKRGVVYVPKWPYERFLETCFYKLVMHWDNECKNKIIDSVLSENPLLHTDKADKKNHGKGISIVKSIAKKYGGDVVISEKNNEFIVSVILDNRIFTKNPLFLPDWNQIF